MENTDKVSLEESARHCERLLREYYGFDVSKLNSVEVSNALEMMIQIYSFRRQFVKKNGNEK